MSKEIALMSGGEWTPDYERTIRDTFCKGLTDSEIMLFMQVCKRTGLDPTMKQIYAVKRKDSKLGREVMTIQTSIDGYRAISERTGKYAPGRESTYTYDKDGNLFSATSYIKKQTQDGTWHEVANTAFWKEYVQTYNGEPTKFWKTLGHVMLAKCAEAGCHRKANPFLFGYLYTQEEMAQSSNEVEIEPVKQFTPLTPEEVSEYISSFGFYKDRFCEYIEKLSINKGWDMDKTIFECYHNQENVKRTFTIWLEKNRPIGLEDKAQGE